MSFSPSNANWMLSTGVERCRNYKYLDVLVCIYLVIDKLITALKLHNVSPHYLGMRSNPDVRKSG